MNNLYDPNEDTELIKWVETNVIPVVAEMYTVRQSAFVGSTFIQGRNDRDLDVLVLIEPTETPECLTFGDDLGNGWVYGGSIHGECQDHFESWGSWKKTMSRDGQPVEVNLLVCTSADYFSRWLQAAEVCRFLQLSGLTFSHGTMPWKSIVRGVHDILMDDALADGTAERLKKEYVSGR